MSDAAVSGGNIWNPYKVAEQTRENKIKKIDNKYLKIGKLSNVFSSLSLTFLVFVICSNTFGFLFEVNGLYADHLLVDFNFIPIKVAIFILAFSLVMVGISLISFLKSHLFRKNIKKAGQTAPTFKEPFLKTDVTISCVLMAITLIGGSFALLSYNHDSFKPMAVSSVEEWVKNNDLDLSSKQINHLVNFASAQKNRPLLAENYSKDFLVKGKEVTIELSKNKDKEFRFYFDNLQKKK